MATLELNLGSHACIASSLSNESPLQLLVFAFDYEKAKHVRVINTKILPGVSWPRPFLGRCGTTGPGGAGVGERAPLLTSCSPREGQPWKLEVQLALVAWVQERQPQGHESRRASPGGVGGAAGAG